MHVEGHSNPAYNGDYEEGEDWGGQPHMMNEDGMHLYWL